MGFEHESGSIVLETVCLLFTKFIYAFSILLFIYGFVHLIAIVIYMSRFATRLQRAQHFPAASGSSRGPVSYSTLTEARTALNAPADANYVMWTFGNQDIETVHASLGANDILVLPERPEPYEIDSSKGFMASGVTGVDGTGADGKKDGSIEPVISNSRLWFEMTRARRGIIGMGPGAVIQPSTSTWTRSAQPILQNEPSGQQFQTIYYANSTTGTMVGAAETLIGYAHSNAFFANFTLNGRTFGGVAYSSIKPTGGAITSSTFKNILFNECWRSHEGVPNAETGCMTLNGGTYLIEDIDIVPPTDSVSGGSCIMWNNNTGGIVRNVQAAVTNLPSGLGGMWTFWRCGGVNTFENVYIRARKVGVNMEESNAGFELNWTGGQITLDHPTSKFHLVGNPTGGPPKVALTGVDVSPNGYTASSLVFNVYTTYGVAKRSYITCDNMPVSCVPDVAWID